MPDSLDVGALYTIRVTAISPSTGAVVAGVNVNQTVFEVTALGDNLQDLVVGPFMLVPGPNA
jgi:hypothetical protein